MRYGLIDPHSDPRALAELAAEAEAAAWDGIFVADALAIETKDVPAFPWFDPWVALAAMAMRTQRIRLGTFITPLPRRRPWKLARETGTLDHLSGGRVILCVGIGAAKDDAGFYKVGEPMDIKVRAELLDEGLEILAGLWSGKPFAFDGQHYHVKEMTMLPATVQQPRIPVWVVGVWPRMKSMRRALHWDGVVPQKYRGMGTVSAEDVAAIRKLVDEQRPKKKEFDIISGGTTPGKNRKKAVKKVQPYIEAGATWWLESMMGSPNDPIEKHFEATRTRIRQGPPRPE